MSKPWRPKKIDKQGGAARSCQLWNLEFKTEDGTTSVRLIDGLVNNMTASNINEWVAISEEGFLLLPFSVSGGSITEFNLVFSADIPAPIEDAEGTPPTEFDVFLARVFSFTAICRFTKALSILPYVSREVSVPPSEPAEDNTVRYYTWKINEI